jgi:hypothetical protein
LHPFSRSIAAFAVWLIVVCDVSRASLAHAQGVESSAPTPAAAAEEAARLDDARRLFEEGLAQVEAGEWAQAEQSFRRVLAIRSSPVVAYNLASALAQLGRLLESAELLRVVVRDASVDAATRDPAQQLLASIEPRIGSVTVRVQGDTQGVILRLDDRVLGQGELVQAISVDPGTHLVFAERDGKRVASEEVHIGGDAPLMAEVTFDLREKAPPPPLLDLRVSKLPHEEKKSAERDDGSMWSSPWLWTGAGAVVLIAAGVVVAVLVAGAEDSVADPIGGNTDPPIVRGRVEALR